MYFLVGTRFLNKARNVDAKTADTHSNVHIVRIRAFPHQQEFYGPLPVNVRRAAINSKLPLTKKCLESSNSEDAILKLLFLSMWNFFGAPELMQFRNNCSYRVNPWISPVPLHKEVTLSWNFRRILPT